MNEQRRAETMAKALPGLLVGVSLALCAFVAQANFLGRDSNNMPSSTCTASGVTKCTSYYDTTLDITILNNWDIGTGFWSATAAAGSAQAVAETAGFDATGLTGWILPTGDSKQQYLGGPLNQYASIINEIGGSIFALRTLFDGVGYFTYWSSSVYEVDPTFAWSLVLQSNGLITLDPDGQVVSHYAVAVRPGDVCTANGCGSPVGNPAPEPGTLALLGLGLAGLAASRRRKQ